MDNNVYLRLADVESKVQYEYLHSYEGLLHQYLGACDTHDEALAAECARGMRNILLNETDSQMALDRLSLPTPETSSIEAWLPFLQTLGDVLGGAWAKYRQDLRDLPTQIGWPFEIEWPVRPDVLKIEEEAK